ncbi:MAG: hypothetical protein IPM48_08830 [Saprospiraceae bacterium]|nr:hypothetical protein [Saprospiraceae bacterium]
MNYRIVFLIGLILLAASSFLIRSNFSYLTSPLFEDNFNKCFRDAKWLHQYYMDSLHFKIKREDCSVCEVLTLEEVKAKMILVYQADFAFAFSYLLIFCIIAWKINRQSPIIYRLIFMFPVIFLLVISDVGENFMMIAYFQEMSESNLKPILQWLNRIKTILFIYCVFTLIVLQIPFLYNKFKDWMGSSD